ncbi:HAD family phosphatase [Clostridium sp. cel8]|nr:HAD family phosphatase [Clostridium sp. cel8]
MLKNIDAAIFDMDGTLLDSMGMWDDIDEEYLKKRNIDLPLNLKSDIEHMSFKETAQYFKETFNIKDSIDVIEKEWYDMAFKRYTTKKMIRPHVKEFLQILKSRNIKIGLATSNYMETSISALKTNEIYSFFDIIVTTQQVNRGKDFPDIFLLTSNKLNVPCKNCVVFEDSLPAIKAAKSANMKVIAVNDLYSPHKWEDILKYSDAGIESFSEITFDFK